MCGVGANTAYFVPLRTIPVSPGTEKSKAAPSRR